MNGRTFAPVKEGDELEVKIEAVGEKGDGIAKIDGFVLFVPKTKEGEVVKIRITRVYKSCFSCEASLLSPNEIGFLLRPAGCVIELAERNEAPTPPAAQWKMAPAPAGRDG